MPPLRSGITSGLGPCIRPYIYAIQFSLRKSVKRVSPILVMFAPRSDLNFERSGISLKENERDGVDEHSNGLDYRVRKNEGKILSFSAD